MHKEKARPREPGRHRAIPPRKIEWSHYCCVDCALKIASMRFEQRLNKWIPRNTEVEIETPTHQYRCLLCLAKGRRVHSHVLPEFMVKGTEDWIVTGGSRQPQPHMTLVDYETALPTYRIQKGNALKREGITEALLCVDCEKILWVGEDYVRRTLYGRAAKKTHTRAISEKIWYKRRYGRVVREGLQLRSVDFTSFKQFQIGVIWRCCVATRAEFSRIRPPPVLVEQMRNCLQTGAFEENFIPCFMEKLHGEPEACFGILALPKMYGSFVSLVMGGYVWHYQLEADGSSPFAVKKTGKLLIKITDLDVLFTPDHMLESRAGNRLAEFIPV